MGDRFGAPAVATPCGGGAEGGDVTPWRPERSALVLLLRACSLDSGLPESGLTELWAETSDETLARELRSLLQDVDTLAAECTRLFSSVKGHRRDQRMPVTQLYEMTQRLIYCLGGRDEEVLAHIADIFTATSAGRETEGVGRVEFQGHVASVLTQILRELEARPGAAAEADRHRLAYTFCDGFHDLCQEEDDPTWLPPPRKGPRPQPPAPPQEPEPAPAAQLRAVAEEAKPEEAPLSAEERQAMLLAKMKEPPKPLGPPPPPPAPEAAEPDEQRAALKRMAALDDRPEASPAADLDLDEQRTALRRMAALDSSMEATAPASGLACPPPLGGGGLRAQEPLREPGSGPPPALEGPRSRAGSQDLNSPRPSMASTSATHVGCLSVGGLSAQEPLREPRPQRPPRAGRSSLEWQEPADLPDPSAPTPRMLPQSVGGDAQSYFIGNDDDDDGVPVEVAPSPSHCTDDGDGEDAATPGEGLGFPVPGAPSSKCRVAAVAAGHWECAACTLLNQPGVLICAVCETPRLTEDGAWASPAACASSAAKAEPGGGGGATGGSWVRRVAGSLLQKLDGIADSFDSVFSAAPLEDAPPAPHGVRGAAEAEQAERRRAEEALLASRRAEAARGGPAAAPASAAAQHPARPAAAAIPGGGMPAPMAPQPSQGVAGGHFPGVAQQRDPPPNAGGHLPSPCGAAVYMSRGAGEAAPHPHRAAPHAPAQSAAGYPAAGAQLDGPSYHVPHVPQGATHVPAQRAAAQVADMAIQAEVLLQEEGLPAYVVVKRDWTPRRLVLTRRHLHVNQEGHDGATFELDELNKVVRRCRHGQHCLSLQFEEGALLLRFSYAVHLEVFLRALLQSRRLPVIEARD